MDLNEIAYNVYAYVYAIVIIGAIIVYSLNLGGYKDDYMLCSSYYGESVIKPYEKQIYWLQDGLCCHYTLNDDNNIIEQCL